MAAPMKGTGAYGEAKAATGLALLQGAMNLSGGATAARGPGRTADLASSSSSRRVVHYGPWQGQHALQGRATVMMRGPLTRGPPVTGTTCRSSPSDDSFRPGWCWDAPQFFPRTEQPVSLLDGIFLNDAATGPGWGTVAMRGAAGRAPRPPAGLQLLDVPSEILQSVMDWLPSFRDRARMCRTCGAAGRLEWRLAPPLWLDEELSGLGLGDRGGCAVARALVLPPNNSLGELCLGSNGIGDRGAQDIAAAFGSGMKLRRLSLRDNEIGDDGAWALATALHMDTMLEELDMWGNRLSDVGKDTLLSLAKCEVFVELNSAPHLRTVSLRNSVSMQMRAILFDWISQVLTGVTMPVASVGGAPDPQDILFRTFTYVDEYLSRRPTSHTELQLLGVACTLVASGLDTSNEAEDRENLATWLAFVTDGASTPTEVISTMQEVHQVLRFKLHQPSVYTFLRRYLRRTGWTEESFSLANYLIEISCIDSAFLAYKPQAIAAAAAVLSQQYASQGVGVRHIFGWKVKLLQCAHVDLKEELAPCIAAMMHVHAAIHSRPNTFVNKKYAWAKLHTVAKISPNQPKGAAFFVTYLSPDAA